MLIDPRGHTNSAVLKARNAGMRGTTFGVPVTRESITDIAAEDGYSKEIPRAPTSSDIFSDADDLQAAA